MGQNIIQNYYSTVYACANVTCDIFQLYLAHRLVDLNQLESLTFWILIL